MSQPITYDSTLVLSECTCPNVNFTGGKCWVGSYCPAGSHYPLPCDGGSYCSQAGLHAPEGLCNAGYYCNMSDIKPDPSSQKCPPGYYCPEGSATPLPCKSGTMSNTEGNIQESDCSDCTAGYFCAGTANTNYTGPCAPGYYCPPGQQVSEPVEYNCTLGYHCPEGSPSPVSCTIGTYQDDEGGSTCKTCPAGRSVKIKHV